MKSKNIILGIIGLLVLAGGIVFGLILVRQNQDFREKAAPATAMYVTPSTQNKTPGSNFNFSVKVDTGSNLMTGVSIKMNFDPNKFEITSVQKGADASVFDSVVTNTYDNGAGTITHVSFLLDKTKAITGSGLEILVVSGKVKDGISAGSSNFTFNSTTSASGVDEGQNILTTTTGAAINITAGTSATATATATSAGATATATATSAGRTATPTATSGATATATATSAGRTATPTATATATSYSGSNTSQTATPTAFPVPVTGSSWMTYMGIGAGVFAILASFLLAL